LRIVLVLETLAGHRSSELVGRVCEQGVVPLSTPVGGSWLTVAASVQRIRVPHALAGQYPKNALQIIDRVEHTVAGWNQEPTPCVCNGTRRQRRERARFRRLAGSGAALVKGYAIGS
jgi:hypothetical protein